MPRDPRLFPKYHDLAGIPFVEGGRSPEQGFDCIGVALWVLAREGHELPDPRADDGTRRRFEKNYRVYSRALCDFRRRWRRVDGLPRDYDLVYVPLADRDGLNLVLDGAYWTITANRQAGVVLLPLRRVMAFPDTRVYRLAEQAC